MVLVVGHHREWRRDCVSVVGHNGKRKDSHVPKWQKTASEVRRHYDGIAEIPD